MAKTAFQQIDELLAHQQRQHGDTPMLRASRKLAVEGMSRADAWQRTAACITDYPYARDEIKREQEAARQQRQVGDVTSKVRLGGNGR